MRSPLTLLIALLCTYVSSAQKLPSYSKIDKADLEYKECTYDKEAAAEYLIDYGEVSYYFNSTDFVNQTKHRIRIKILKEKAVDLANIRISYYSKGNRQRITNIDGHTFNLNEKGDVEETKLEKKAVMTQKLDENYNMLVFTLPNVKIGSVIEFRYEIEKHNYIEIDDWEFQRAYPVRHSEYNAKIPSVLEFTYQVKRTLPMKETTEGIEPVKTFIMNNIPGLDKEPYMSCAKDYLQRVDFQLSAINKEPIRSTWEKLTTDLLDDDDFGMQLKKNILKNLPLEDELKKLPTNFDKILAVLNFVKANVPWDGTNSFWCKNGLKTAVDKHEGNSADVNMLVINLLRDAGIRAYPVLVSTRDHGKINAAYPFLYQFNNVYVYTYVNNQALILDATNQYGSPTMIPWDVQYTYGYLVDTERKEFIPLEDNKHKYRVTNFIDGYINEKGEIEGQASVQAFDYARTERLQLLNKNKESYLKEYFTSPHPEFKFDSLKTKNEKVDSLPLETTVKFKAQLNSSGDYFFYSPNFLTELEKNEFIAENRFTDIEFGYTQYFNFTTTIRFSQNLELEELPTNMKMILPDTSIILYRFIQKNESSVSFRYTLEIKRPIYYADEYLDFKAFYAVLFDKMNEQLVFKKKTRP